MVQKPAMEGEITIPLQISSGISWVSVGLAVLFPQGFCSDSCGAEIIQHQGVTWAK